MPILLILFAHHISASSPKPAMHDIVIGNWVSPDSEYAGNAVFVYMPFCLPVSMSFCLSIYMSVCLSVFRIHSAVLYLYSLLCFFLTLIPSCLFSAPVFGPTSLVINNECGGEDKAEPGNYCTLNNEYDLALTQLKSSSIIHHKLSFAYSSKTDAVYNFHFDFFSSHLHSNQSGQS